MPRTVVVYGDALDGRIYGDSAVYATARSTSTSCATANANDRLGQLLSGGTYTVYRLYVRFPISLPLGSVIVSATLSLKLQSDVSTTDFNGVVYSFPWVAPLCGGDREANYDGAYGSGVLVGNMFATSVVSTGVYYNLSIPAAYVPINGYASFAVVSSRDVASQTPVGNEYVTIYMADDVAANQPKLTLTYEEEPRAPLSSFGVGSPPLISLYDRNGRAISESLLGQAVGLEFGSIMPGGFQDCQFNIPVALQRVLKIQEGFRLSIKCGMGIAWEGRVADIQRGTSEGGYANILAFGGYEHTGQIKTSYTAATGETALNVLQVALSACPLLSRNYSDIGEPGFALSGRAWDRQYVQQIGVDCAKAGDSQTPPRQWFFSVWEAEEIPVTGSHNATITANNDDGQVDTTGADDSYSAVTVRIGRSAGANYHGGFIFRNLPIPRYARITTATLGFTSSGDLGADEPVTVRIRGERSSNPDDWSVSWPDSRVTTVAYKDWSITWPAAGAVSPGQIVSIVQEVVNLSSWYSGGSIAIILINTGGAGDTRKNITSLEGGSPATLALAWEPSAETTMAFHPEFIPRRQAIMSNVDYIISADDVEGELKLTYALDELYNAVTARYGAGPSYTSEATDELSIERYDRRENNPDQLDAGSTGTLTQANNLRDAFLDVHKDPRPQVGDLAMRRIRDRWGNYINPAMVRAGSVVRLVDFIGITEEDCAIFFVSKTRYADGLLTLSLETEPDTLDIMVSRLTEK